MQIRILLFLVILFATFQAKAQSADQVIKNYVKFIGGRKWKKVKTITTSGEYNYGGIAFPFTTYSKRPDRYKFVVPFNGKYYVQAFDGTKGWKMDAFKNEMAPTWLAGKPARAMANEADVELEDALINYQNKGHHAILEGRDTIEKNLCYKVKFIRKEGEVETYFFSEKTFEIAMKTSVSKNAELENARINIYYSDYRDIGGTKIPFKMVSQSNGQTILIITTAKAEVNVPIDDVVFQP